MSNIQRVQFAAVVLSLIPFAPDRVRKSITDREANRPQNSGLSVDSYPPLVLASAAGYIRHHLTDYDYLLAEKHLTRFMAQTKVQPIVSQTLSEWRGNV